LQKPPPYSALKLNGRRLSDLTRYFLIASKIIVPYLHYLNIIQSIIQILYVEHREGVVVDTEPRPVDCYELEVIDFTPPALSLRLVCGRGFYVRSLIHDLGLGKL